MVQKCNDIFCFFGSKMATLTFDISIRSEFTSKNAQVVTSEMIFVPNILNQRTEMNEMAWYFFCFGNSYKNIQSWRIKYKKFGYYCIIVVVISILERIFLLSLLLSFEQSWTGDMGFKESITVPFNWCSRNKITKQVNTKPLHMAT